MTSLLGRYPRRWLLSGEEGFEEGHMIGQEREGLAVERSWSGKCFPRRVLYSVMRGGLWCEVMRGHMNLRGRMLLDWSTPPFRSHWIHTECSGQKILNGVRGVWACAKL